MQLNRQRRVAVAPVSYQTIKLAKGKHASPAKGVCVMELASMLAGEPFSDHPACACPVISSFLRSYNDSIDDGRRQDLYAYASKVVGSRAPTSVQRARVERLAEWGLELHLHQQRWTRLVVPDRWRVLARARGVETVVRLTIDAIRKDIDRLHTEVLELVDELLAMGRDDQPRAYGADDLRPPARRALTPAG
jgi:hypothetical protein